MRLDHINLTVRDVGEASAFLKEHFGYRDLFQDGDAGIVALDDGSGPSVLLMRGPRAMYPKLFHIGFDLETESNVDAMHRRLVDDGLDATEPKRVPWGSYTFQCTIPGGDFTIEVACLASDAA